MSQRAVLWCRSDVGNKEDLALQNQVLSFYCKERGMKEFALFLNMGKRI